MFTLVACGELFNIDSILNSKDNTTTDTPTTPDNPSNPDNPGENDPENPTNPDNPGGGDPENPSNPDNPGGDNGTGEETVTCSGALVKHERYNQCVYPEQIKCTVFNPAFPGTTYSHPDPCFDDPNYQYLKVLPNPNPGAVKNPTTELEILATKYPYANYGVSGFRVIYYPDRYQSGIEGLPANVTATQDKIEAAKRITVKEKKNMLKMLAIIRYVINTEEYEKAFMAKQYCAPKNYDFYDKWTMALAKWLKNERFLYVIRNRQYYSLEFIKTNVPSGEVARSKLGIETLYSAYDEKLVRQYNVTQGEPPEVDMPMRFPNRIEWTEQDYGFGQSGYYSDESFLAPWIYHEALHNLGLPHYSSSPVPKPFECDPEVEDPVYYASQAMREVMRDEAFKIAHKKGMDEFKDFYIKLYADMLKEDTVWAQATRSLSFNLFDDGNSQVDSGFMSCPVTHY